MQDGKSLQSDGENHIVFLFIRIILSLNILRISAKMGKKKLRISASLRKLQSHY